MTTEEKIRWLAEQAGWLTPDALDREHWRWRGMRRQKGGWDQELWVALQETWRMWVVTGSDSSVVIYANGTAGSRL